MVSKKLNKPTTRSSNLEIWGSDKFSSITIFIESKGFICDRVTNKQNFGKLLRISIWSRALLRVHVSQADGRLLLLDVQFLGLLAGDRNCGYIAAATRSPIVLATNKGPAVSGTQEEAEKPVRNVTAAIKKMQVRRSRV